LDTSRAAIDEEGMIVPKHIVILISKLLYFFLTGRISFANVSLENVVDWIFWILNHCLHQNTVQKWRNLTANISINIGKCKSFELFIPWFSLLETPCSLVIDGLEINVITTEFEVKPGLIEDVASYKNASTSPEIFENNDKQPQMQWLLLLHVVQLLHISITELSITHITETIYSKEKGHYNLHRAQFHTKSEASSPLKPPGIRHHLREQTADHSASEVDRLESQRFTFSLGKLTSNPKNLSNRRRVEYNRRLLIERNVEIVNLTFHEDEKSSKKDIFAELAGLTVDHIVSSGKRIDIWVKATRWLVGVSERGVSSLSRYLSHLYMLDPTPQLYQHEKIVFKDLLVKKCPCHAILVDQEPKG
jgi:hypothetical protein